MQSNKHLCLNVQSSVTPNICSEHNIQVCCLFVVCVIFVIRGKEGRETVPVTDIKGMSCYDGSQHISWVLIFCLFLSSFFLFSLSLSLSLSLTLMKCDWTQKSNFCYLGFGHFSPVQVQYFLLSSSVSVFFFLILLLTLFYFFFHVNDEMSRVVICRT